MEMLEFYFTVLTCVIFIVIGCYGNILSIVIFSNKEFKKQPTVSYLIISNIINMATILYLPVAVFPEIWTFNTITCKILYGLLLILGELQSWVFAVCSVDRCITVLNSFKYQFKNKLTFQLIFILTIILILIALCLPIVYFYEKTTISFNQSLCSFSDDNSWIYTYNKYQFILFRTLIPFMLTITASIMTILKLNSSKRRANVVEMVKEFEFAKSLIIMDILFVIFRLPTFIYVIINNDISLIYNFFYTLFVLLAAIHYVFVFLIFIVFNKIYRRLFKQYFCFKTKVISEPKISMRKNKQIELSFPKSEIILSRFKVLES